jgi:hypothetical protein
MAFTNTPVNDTYRSEKIVLMHDLDLAPAGTDLSSLIGGAVNIFPFKDEKGELYGETRYSLQAESVTFATPVDSNHFGMLPPASNAIVRGLYVWERDQDFFNYFVVVDDSVGSRVFMKFYPDTGPTHPWGWVQCANITDGTMLLHTAGRGVVRFCDYVDATNQRMLVMSDGTDLYTIDDGGGLRRCVDADMPSPHAPFPVAIDGYVFLAKATTSHTLGYADIYNSDLNNPLSWTAGSFISAEMYADRLKALVRVNNYILAIGQDSCEYFYDAGNALGSPLARYENAAIPVGCLHPNSIAYLKDTTMFLGNPGNGEQCFVFIKGFKHKIVEAKAVTSVLQKQLNDGTTDFTKLRAGFFHQEGQLFYFLAFDGTQTDTGWTTETVVYSVDCDMWVRTRSDMYNGSPQPSGQYGFPVLFTHDTVSRFPYTFFAGQMSVTGKVVFGHLDPNVKYDQFDPFNTYNIYQEINVPPYNADTWNRKFMSRLSVNYRVKGGDDNTTGAVGLVVKYSDDQGVSYSTVFPAGSKANDFPFYLQLGSFRERMFKIVNYSTRMRFYNLEVDINKGQQ